MNQDELTRGQNSKGPMKQGPVEGGQNGSGLSGIRPNWLRTNWEDPVYCYLEFKLSYLKNLKLFSIRVKELFEPIVKIIKNKGWRGFALFKSIFSRNRPLSNARRFCG